MSGPAPWWASDGADALDPDQDPLARHLRARRGTDRVEDETDGGDRPDGTDGEQERGRGDDGRHDPAICGVCPICRSWSTLQDRHPEVAEHVVEAARHLAKAMDRFADAMAASAADRPSPDPGPSGTGPTATARPPRGDPGGGGGFRPILLDDEGESP